MILQPIRDTVLTEHLSSISSDATDLYLAAEGTVRIAIVHATTTANLMRTNHNLNPTAAFVLGQAAIGAILSATTLKNGENLSLIASLDGPLRGITVEANAGGQVRGYLHHHEVHLSPGETIESLYGNGTLAVRRRAPNEPHAMQGEVEWKRGDLTRNIANYYAHSEQTATLIDINVHFDDSDRIVGAAGILIQLLPGGEEATIEAIGHALEASRPLGLLYARGGTTGELVRTDLKHWEPQLIGTRGAEFYCGCTKERFGRFMAALPEQERAAVLQSENFPIATTCHHCNSIYTFGHDELEELFARSSQQ